MAEEITYFAAGCFWHVQQTFDKTPGVLSTEAGYMGGDEENFPNPTYKQVCSGETGYAETVKVIFNPEKISYSELLDIFWGEHDPTSYNKQGADIGEQYRAVIFYTSEEQKIQAEESKRQIQNKFKGKTLYTSIEKAKTFFKAEDIHQHYLGK